MVDIEWISAEVMVHIDFILLKLLKFFHEGIIFVALCMSTSICLCMCEINCCIGNFELSN